MQLLINDDCFNYLPLIEDKSVDMILCDLPYGNTHCSWDSPLDLTALWKEYERVIKDHGAILLFAQSPFDKILACSNLKLYRYDWIWEKGRASGFVHAKNKPLKCHETISVFSQGTTVHASQSKNRMKYFPQMSTGKPYVKKITQPNTGKLNHSFSKSNIDFVGTVNENEGTRYPRTIIKFSMHNVGNMHPTQKPVALLEYLIRTYTNEGETVLDFTMGSGSTGVACVNTNRNFIGMELDQQYFEIAKKRIEEAQAQLKITV